MAETATRVTATFDVLSWDETPLDVPGDGPALTRATVKKVFHGDIEAESTAELVLCRTDEAQAYVAQERIVGRIGDRTGSFILQHCAMQGGDASRAHWFVIPGSGTGDLRGLRGEATYRHDDQGAVFTLEFRVY